MCLKKRPHWICKCLYSFRHRILFAVPLLKESVRHFQICTGMWKDEKRLNQDLTQLPIQWDKISIKFFMMKLIIDCHNSPCQEENSWSRKKSGRSNANFWTQLHFARECGGIFSGISFSIKLSGTLAPLRRRGCFCSTFHILRPSHRKTSASGNEDLSLRGILPIPHLQTNIQVDRILCDRRAPVLQLLNKVDVIIWCFPRKAFPSHVDDIKN